jgi:type II secretion system protein J
MSRQGINKGLTQNHGFTLIEVVIASTIFVIMGTIAYRTLTLILSTKQTLDVRRQDNILATALLTRLTKELQLAVSNQRSLLPPRGSNTNATGKAVYMRSEAQRVSSGKRGDSLTFLALDGAQYFPDGATRNGIVQITYRLADDPEERGKVQLIRDETPLLSTPALSYQRSIIFPLSTRVIALRFSFYGGSSDRWVGVWGNNNQDPLPEMIQATFTFGSLEGEEKEYSTTVSLVDG